MLTVIQWKTWKLFSNCPCSYTARTFYTNPDWACPNLYLCWCANITSCQNEYAVCIRFFVRTSVFIPVANKVKYLFHHLIVETEKTYISSSIFQSYLFRFLLCPLLHFGLREDKRDLFRKNNVQISISSLPYISPVPEEEGHGTDLKIVLIEREIGGQ